MAADTHAETSILYPITILLHIMVASNQACSQIGWTEPAGDIYMEMDSPLEIFCVLNTSRPEFAENNANSIVFYRDSERLSGEYVNIINDTTARLHIDGVRSSGEYSCRIIDMADYKALQASDDKPIFTEELVCSNSVTVGDKVAPITNFECLSYNWEVLNCTWTPPENAIKTRYEVHYELPASRARKSRPHFCPNDDDVQLNRCSWTLDTDPPYRRTYSIYTFVITGHNALGDMVQKITFDHYSRLVPSAPQDLVAASKTPSSVHLKWCIGVLCVFENGLKYKIESSADSSTWNTHVYDESDVEMFKDEIAFNVTGLSAGKSYTFKVYTKSATAEDKLWSKPAILEVKTPTE